MNEEIFSQQLAWAKNKGLFLNEKIERKKVNGVYGMFATGNIAKDEILVSYPVQSRTPQFSDVSYPVDTANDVKNMHRAAVEYQKGKLSDYHGHFIQFESLDDFKSSSVYFLTEDELALIQSMNRLLYKSVTKFNSAVKKHIDTLLHIDPAINTDVATLIVLNYCSRAWGDVGFLPVIDLFNHSEKLGNTKEVIDQKDILLAKVDYQAGDQIWISYSVKDIYHHCIIFNYFDPNDTHYIHFGDRFTQTATSNFERQIAHHCLTKYNIASSESDGALHYQITDVDALFLEHAPSVKLVEYIKDNCFRFEEEFSAKNCSFQSFIIRMNEVLNILIGFNNVDKINLAELPDKLHRFFYMLQKEKQMLLKNLEWVSFLARSR